MSVLVLLAHPNLATSRVNRVWTDSVREAGHAVRDLYALYPNGQIDHPAEQAACEASSIIVFQHPMNWYAGPWLLKKWIDEVLEYDWAYGRRYALQGKVLAQAVSIGAGEPEYRPEGSRRYPAEEFFKPYERTAVFCKMSYELFYRYGAGYEPDDVIARWAAEYVEWLKQLSSVARG